jgi:hypothetical protein
MNTYAERRATAREPGRWQAARVITAIAAAIAAVIVLGILLVVFDANQSNGLVDAIMDVAGFFVEPFKGLFSMDSHEAQVALNWGIGAAVYLLVGSLIARLIRR